MNYTILFKEIEDLLFILLVDNVINEKFTYTCLTLLCDKSNISNKYDLDNIGLNKTTIFVEKSMNFLRKELYDDWLEYYKSELINIENYELIVYLNL